jgi:hypothetical protein
MGLCLVLCCPCVSKQMAAGTTRAGSLTRERTALCSTSPGALALGFRPSEEDVVETGGTAGDARTWFFDLQLVVAGKRFPARAGFVYTPALARRGLLGRADFFNAFSVGFDQRGLRVLLNPLT